MGVTQSRWIFIALMLAMFGSGCAYTTLETARPLKAGEVVLGSALEWPGPELDPGIWYRLGAYGKVGLGDKADLGLVGGYDFRSANLGASGRVYLNDMWMVGVQADVRRNLGPGTREVRAETGRVVDLIAANARISTMVHDRVGPYMGVQATYLSTWLYERGEVYESDEGPTVSFQSYLLGLGGFVGAERKFFSGWSVQGEVMLLPLHIDFWQDRVTLTDIDADLGLQISVGMNYRFGGEPEAARRPTPTKVEPEEEPASDRVPDRNGGRVPVY